MKTSENNGNLKIVIDPQTLSTMGMDAGYHLGEHYMLIRNAGVLTTQRGHIEIVHECTHHLITTNSRCYDIMMQEVGSYIVHILFMAHYFTPLETLERKFEQKRPTSIRELIEAETIKLIKSHDLKNRRGTVIKPHAELEAALRSGYKNMSTEKFAQSLHPKDHMEDIFASMALVYFFEGIIGLDQKSRYTAHF